MVALVDCNNFYASCERVFRPELRGKPVVVLSNNDGCIIARSNEAKALDIPMGAPLFKHRQVIHQNKVHLFSTNFALYGDMSKRVMQCLSLHVPNIEIYSIDEAFLHLKTLDPNQAYDECCKIHDLVKKWTGIPVSIGLSWSKTLAKAAAKVAKKCEPHVYDMREEIVIEDTLRTMDLEDIWGLSYKGSRHWKGIGLYTPLDIRRSDAKKIRKKLGIVGERLVYELQGNPVIEKERIGGKKNIMSTRSFTKKITDILSLYRALSNYTFRACQKLREQKSYARGVYVFIRSSYYKDKADYIKKSCTLMFDVPSQDSSYILNQVKKALRNMYQPGVAYAKAGIVLIDLVDETKIQGNFFQTYEQANNIKTMSVIDKINQKAGKDVMFLAAQGTLKSRQKKDIYKSPNYTTQWKELLTVR